MTRGLDVIDCIEGLLSKIFNSHLLVFLLLEDLGHKLGEVALLEILRFTALKKEAESLYAWPC